jgi:two-component system, NarL family, sensor histidine kinase EvgS
VPGIEVNRMLAYGSGYYHFAVRKDWAPLLARRPVWRVGAVRGLALLNEIDEHGLHSGIAAEYSDQVARRLGVAVQVRAFDTVAQMLDGLRAGDIDIVPLLTGTPEREREFAYSAPYVEMPYVLVARNDAPLWWGLDSLRGKRLALPLQHALRPLLRERYPDINVLDAEGGTGAMDMVIRGEAEAVIEVKLFANLRINSP